MHAVDESGLGGHALGVTFQGDDSDPVIFGKQGSCVTGQKGLLVDGRAGGADRGEVGGSFEPRDADCQELRLRSSRAQGRQAWVRWEGNDDLEGLSFKVDVRWRQAVEDLEAHGVLLGKVVSRS